ncbi:hypothetical protein KY348_05165 [Candidatus Woesearchaeota archaeon]|nr:hypothetical protein [Candidatus Woesearchaeota archaeon]
MGKDKSDVRTEVRKNKLALCLIYLGIIILISISIGSLSFISSPSINPSPSYTEDNLNCSWIPSADTTQTNVSWYQDGALFSNASTSQNESILPYQNTSKNQNWTCNVTITNGTNTTWAITSIIITNSPPQEPYVYNTSGQDVGSSETVNEDQAYTYDINSTDPDGDTLTYRRSPAASFCTVTDENTGAVTCSPTASDLGSNNTIGQINITFWADDTDPFFPTSKGHTVLFNVTPVNDNPEFDPALTDQVINESQVLNYYIYGSDEENNTPLNFTINVTPSLALIINITSNTTAIITFENNRTAQYDEAGNYTINVTVYDNLSASNTSSFNLEIRQVNQIPVLENITIQNGTQGQNFSFYVYADDEDVNDTLNFTIVPTVCSISNPWSITTVNGSNNATGLVNISNLTNNHVICRNVNITVIDDTGAEDSQDVFLNISNTNDPPNIGVLSSYSNNTGGNNITNLTGYGDSLFIYMVNATDPDEDTYEGEVLAYADNTSLFEINSSTGLISFTPNQSQVGNHTILINVSDDGGLIDTQVMNLEVQNNTAPVLMSIGNLSCSEDNLCFIIINASDADNDNLTFTSNNTAVFNLTDNLSQNPVMSAYINYTPLQSQVGNYSIVITVADPKSASDTETIIFTINNTNDAPVFQVFSFPTIVETHTVSFYACANDEDYDLNNSYENLTFSDTNLTGKDLFNISTYNQTCGRILFTPQLGDAGDYSVNISVRDYYNATDSVIKNYTVLNRTNPPNITQIRPYGRPYSAQTVFSSTSTSNYNSSLTSINFSENRSVFYNITVTDDQTAQENLSYAWYIDASLNSTNSSLNISYDFHSSSSYNVTVVVSDDTLENASWTWNVTVDNINRRPLFLNPVDNISVNTTTVYTDYLKESSVTHFIDPDDDLNNNNDIDGSETSLLTYAITDCDVATITITGHSVRVVPEEVGNCTVNFTATDSGGLSNTSNTVFINVTDVPEGDVQDPEPSTGGGGGRTRSIVVPMRKEEEKPQAIEIVVPELVTIYENRTVIIPVTIKNTWNSSLFEVVINASTNASYVELEFTEDYFEELSVGENRNITLMVSNYRLGEDYEVKITANVTTPDASDSALVMLNTIEQAEEGEDVETKVTFAQDLLNENPECMELNELLLKAVDELDKGSRQEASKMVSGVIEGCKYLVSISKKEEQKPKSILTRFIKKENLKYLLTFIGLVGLILLSVLLVKKRKTAKGKAEPKQGKETKQEEIKPYWLRP